MTPQTPDRNPIVPDGWHTVTPRIVATNAEGLVAFIKHVFGATGDYLETRPSELRIGDSMVMVSDSGARDPMPAFLYVYVDDTDATYRLAIDAGRDRSRSHSKLPTATGAAWWKTSGGTLGRSPHAKHHLSSAMVPDHCFQSPPSDSTSRSDTFHSEEFR